jgi:hypothetical protein
MRYRMPRFRTTALVRVAGPAAALALVVPAAGGTTVRAAPTSRPLAFRPAGPESAMRTAGRAYPVPGLAPGLSAEISLPPAALSRPGRTGPRHTLTVTGTNLAGQPDTGAYVLVCNSDDSRRYCGDSNLKDGIAKFSLPAGHYWAFVLFTDRADGKAVAGRLVVRPQFTVSGDATVRLAESTATSKITMVTPRPATRLDTTIDLQRTSAAGPAFELSTVAGARAALWVNPTRQRPVLGTLRFGAEQWLASPPGQGTPYLYDLAYQSAGLIPAQRYPVRPARLATVNARFYGAVSSAGYSEPDGWFPHEAFRALGTPKGFGVRVPGRRIDYFSGNPAIVWNDNYSAASGSEGDQGTTFHAGQRLTDDWGRYPLHPAATVNLAGAASPVPIVPSASRVGNVLAVDVTPFTDSTPGHMSFGFLPPVGPKPTGSFEIDQNGQQLAAGNAAAYGAGGPHVTLSPRPSVIRFVLNAARTGPDYPLSASSHTVWIWRSKREPGATVSGGWVCFIPGTEHAAQHCAVEPMMTLGYQIAGLAPDGSTRPGRQSLTVTAGHLALAKAARVTRVMVQVSYDGGQHWHSATVTGSGARYLATYTAPAGSYVTLRTTAADAAGGQISETITGAYRVGDPGR